MSDQNKECVVSIEDNTVEKEASTASEDQNLTTNIEVVGDEDKTCPSISIHELKKLVEAERLGKTTVIQGTKPPKIQRVPFILRERKDFKLYYEPRAVSIGPIHHSTPRLQLAELYKPKLAAKFIKDSEKETEDLYKVIDEKIQELKNWFQEEVIKSYKDKSLSWILFLDGCSVLQFIYSFTKGELHTHFNIKNDHIAFVQHDLLLLENQIPFEVLRLLMNSTPNQVKEGLKGSIEKFICINIMAPEHSKKDLNFDINKLNPIHLLDLLQHVVVPRQPASRKNNTKNQQEHPTQPSFRNVKELKVAGIDLKPSKSCSLREISFSSFCFMGWLRVPPLIVDDSTGPKFLNLIAYESCPDNFRTDYEVTSYISFLDSLIDHADDVKELRSEKILHNLLGCDEEVASLFNEIATDLVPNPEHYKDVKNKIQSHYDNRWMTWMAEAYHAHFSSPWTIMAFVAALVALALSGVQTWFSVFSPSDDDPCANCCCRKS